MKIFTLVTVVSLLPAVGAQAAEISVIAAGATREVYEAVVPDFEKHTGHKAIVTWSGTAGINQKLAEGEVYDVVIVSAATVDRFIQQNRLAAGSRVDLMKSGVGAGVRAGAPKPDISSSAALKSALLAAKSVGYSTGPSGTHIVSVIERLGIADQIKPKMKQVPTGGRIGTMIASGEVDIGFQQVSELIHEPGVDYIGPLPPDVQNTTVYAAGVHAQAKQPDAAKLLIKALTTPAAVAAIRKHGMDPP
jgi:molybdate transport system substrate-binding protein